MTSEPRESSTFYSSIWGLDLKELTSSKGFLVLEQGQRRENLTGDLRDLVKVISSRSVI